MVGGRTLLGDDPKLTVKSEALRAESHALEALRGEPTVTLDGRRIELSANIELPGDVDQVLHALAELTR